MVALASNLPLLKVGDSERTDYDTRWLESHIRDAAQTAGHDGWWFAEDIARSVFVYLEKRFSATVITLEQIADKVRLILRGLAFEDIAKELTIKAPPFRIDLPALAMRAGSGYELVFFQLLVREIEIAAQSGAEYVSVTGVKAATRTLCGTRRWHRGCTPVHRELNAFVEHQLKFHEFSRFCIC